MNPVQNLRQTMREAVRPPPQARQEPTLAQSGPYLLDAVTGEIHPLAVPTPTPALFARWMDAYSAAMDRLETRVSVSTRELTMPAGAWETCPARREFFLQHYRAQYDELCRRAREEPGECFHYIAFIPDAALHLGWPREAYNRAPLPPPAYERERAEKRSMELLYDWLSDAQRKELALEGYFTITGESSGKRYQVHKVHSFGLKELDSDGNVVASFCVVPEGTHALGDTMLAQKIWMETDEETTLARANRMGLAAQALLNAQQLAQYFDQRNTESVLGRTLHGVLHDA